VTRERFMFRDPAAARKLPVDPPTGKPSKKPIVLKRKVSAEVHRNLGSSTAGCRGLYSLYEKTTDGRFREPWIPGWNLPSGTEVTVEITVTVTKLAKEPKQRCLNPWPAHRCDDGIHHGPFGRKIIPKKHRRSPK